MAASQSHHGPATPEFYTLPSSPAYRCVDRFSLLDGDTGSPEEDADGLVPFWPLLCTILSQPVPSPAALTALLDTISATLRGTAHPAGDYALLREAIAAAGSRSTTSSRAGREEEEEKEDGEADASFFLRRVWPRLVKLALEMPALFPAGQLPVLGRGPQSLSLSRKQAACLVVHQFLRTLARPGWMMTEDGEDGICDFGVWYAGEESQRHPRAARAYLWALMRYFEGVVCDEAAVGVPREGWAVEYTVRSLAEDQEGVLRGGAGSGQGCPLGDVEVVVVERYDVSPASLGLPGGAAVVAANKFIGFGRSATQEEVHVGTSPEACPAVLVTPPLRNDQVLVVRGAQAMVNITGRGRDIRVEKMSTPSGGVCAWRSRTMLFMDALELDMVESRDQALPDLLPGNMDREIRKAYTAFSAGGFNEVRTGLWGCGAFGGDPETKMLLLWMAASLAGARLMIICDRDLGAFAEELQLTLERAKGTLQDVKHLRQLLEEGQGHLGRGQVLAWVRQKIE